MAQGQDGQVGVQNGGGGVVNYPRCKTCRHWDDKWRARDRMYYCNHIKLADGLCLDGVFTPVDPIATGPDFGCVHHEAKESE